MFPEISTVSGNAWPVVPPAQGAQVLSLLFQMEQSQWLSPQAIRQYQSRQLLSLLRHAQMTIPFYRDRIAKTGLSLEALVLPDGWSQMPLLSRTEVQEAGKALRSTAPPLDHGGSQEQYTSGSTGKPVNVVTTGLSQLFWQAFTIRDHLWHRRDLKGKLVSLRYVREDRFRNDQGHVSDNWGISTRGLFETGPSASMHIGRSIDLQAQWVAEHDPDYLLTYPSNLRALARYMGEHQMPLPKLKEVRTFGEILEPEVREICREVWGVKVADSYSCQEMGYLAIQCPEQEHHHVQSENVLIEVLDKDDRPCQPGQVGRVVVTSMHNFFCPLIRYAIGDYAEVGGPCSCGRGLPVLKHIVGRQRNMFVFPNGQQKWPSAYISRTLRQKGFPRLRQYQVIQRAPTTIEILLAVEQKLTADQEDLLCRNVEKALDYEGLEVSITYVDHIEPSASGKYEDFRSEVSAGSG